MPKRIVIDGSDLESAMHVAEQFGSSITAQTMCRAIEAAFARHDCAIFIWPAWVRSTPPKPDQPPLA